MRRISRLYRCTPVAVYGRRPVYSYIYIGQAQAAATAVVLYMYEQKTGIARKQSGSCTYIRVCTAADARRRSVTDISLSHALTLQFTSYATCEDDPSQVVVCYFYNNYFFLYWLILLRALCVYANRTGLTWLTESFCGQSNFKETFYWPTTHRRVLEWRKVVFRFSFFVIIYILLGKNA